jgi:uncharacterized protein (TIGR00369 family)
VNLGDFASAVVGTGPGELVPVPASLGAVPAGCVIDRFAITLTTLGRGAAQASMVVQSLHLNQVGVLQGGVAAVLADATAGWATLTVLPPGSTFSTVSLTLNLARAAREGDHLVAHCQSVHTGRTTIVQDVKITRQAGDGSVAALVASFSCTQVLLRS